MGWEQMEKSRGTLNLQGKSALILCLRYWNGTILIPGAFWPLHPAYEETGGNMC